MTLQTHVLNWFPGDGETPNTAINYISPIGGFVVGQISTNHHPVELTHFACWDGHEDSNTQVTPDEQQLADERFFRYLMFKWGNEHHIPRFVELGESRAVQKPLAASTWQTVARIWADAGYVVSMGDFGLEVHDNPLSFDEKRELLDLKATAPACDLHNAYDATEAALKLYGSQLVGGSIGPSVSGSPCNVLSDAVRRAHASGGSILDHAPVGDAALELDYDDKPCSAKVADILESFAKETGMDLADLVARVRATEELDRSFEDKLEARLVANGFLTYTYSDEARFEAHRFPSYVHDTIRAMAGVPRSTRIDGSPHQVAIHNCDDSTECPCPRYSVVSLGSTWNGWACPTFDTTTALRFLGTRSGIHINRGVLRIKEPDGAVLFEPDEDGNYPLGYMYLFEVCHDDQGIRYDNSGWPLDPQFD